MAGWSYRPAAAALVVSAGLISTACSGGSSRVPTVSATVEGATIAGRQTAELVRVYSASSQGQSMLQDVGGLKQLAKYVLSYQIKVAFLRQLAKELKVTVAPDPMASLYGGAADSSLYQQ